MVTTYVEGTWKAMNETDGNGENQSQRRVMRLSTFGKAGVLAVLGYVTVSHKRTLHLLFLPGTLL